VTQHEFDRLAAQGFTRIAVLAEARADVYTPLAVYIQLAGGPYSYLLESVVGGERFGRYSFIGLACAERIEARGTRVRRLLRDARGADVCMEEYDGDPFEYARGWLKRERTAPLPERLRFGGGLVGYFGYEAVRHVEPHALGEQKPDPLGTPDVLLLVSDELAVVDNVLGKLYLVVYADPRQPRAYARACERLEELRHRLARPLPEALVLAQPAPEPPMAAAREPDPARLAQGSDEGLGIGDLAIARVDHLGVARPRVGGMTPATIFSSVDLPAPFSPMRPSDWPRMSSKLTSSSARNTCAAP